MSFTDMCNKYHVSRATISNRKNKEGWSRKEVQRLQERRVDLLHELKAIDAALFRRCWVD